MLAQAESFGIYLHIPYCLQRCTYCDFATYVQTEIMPPHQYVELLKKEISLKKNFFNQFSGKPLSTLYFGGGTPSLLPADLIIDLISELSKQGFPTGPLTEVTIEINPATITEEKLARYLSAGINRFSVGAQTFNDRLLKSVNREHNAQQTFDTLSLLEKSKLNFSFDILYGLPTQTLSDVKFDLERAMQLGSSHISPYCLTVPEGHPLAKNRPPEEEQVEMLQLIHETLNRNSYQRYEISNYAQKNKESQHNLLYWTDQPYWGLGLSAHSYSPTATDWGTRFWNASNINVYEKHILSAESAHQPSHFENLEKHQSLTDFCYTSLRLARGLDLLAVQNKFGFAVKNIVEKAAEKSVQMNYLLPQNDHLILTDLAVPLSNQIFEKFTFLKDDL